MPSINLTVDDVDVSDAHVAYTRRQLNSWRNNYAQKLSVYGKAPALMTLSVITEPSQCKTIDEAKALAAWVTKSWEHADYIHNHVELLLPLLATDAEPDATVEIAYANIKSVWTRDDVLSNEHLRVKSSAVEKLFDGVATLMSTDEAHVLGWQADRALFLFSNDKLSDSYLSDGSQPLMMRSKWLIERNAWKNKLDGMMYARFTFDNGKMIFAVPTLNVNKQFTPGAFLRIAKGVQEAKERLATTPTLWRWARNEVIAMEAQANGTDAAVLEQLKYASYEKFWGDIKTSKRRVAQSVDAEQVAEMWEAIPLADTGTESSRTWGIEVETVRAQQTSRPRGWTDVHDGSLPDGGGGCNCSCDSCDEGEHCEDSDYDCNDASSESREFVSPILNHFNSEGLRKLCNDLGDYESSTAPGIHVHVGASDLTVTDVARLLFAYGVVAPLIQPLYHRKVFGYCKEMDHSNVQWWLSAAKRFLRESGRVPRPRDICHEQPVDRYQDVNTYALAEHTTIEFRAMGPFYNYAHLVRWAWFVREMVNVSRLNLDQRIWTSCKSITDVINVLRKYGSEIPLDKSLLPADADTNTTYEE